MTEIDFGMDVIRTEVVDYFNELYRPNFKQLASFRAMGERNLVPIIRPETESMLAVLLSMRSPKRILEIGTAIGYSTTFFALSCPDAVIYTIEKDEDVYQAALKNVATAGIQDRVHCLLGDGASVISRLGREGVSGIDFVFIDAAKSHYKEFLQEALPLCESGALLVSDNILQHGMTVYPERDPKGKHRTNIRKMKEYLEYINQEPCFQTTLLPIGDGLAITVYNK